MCDRRNAGLMCFFNSWGFCCQGLDRPQRQDIKPSTTFPPEFLQSGTLALPRSVPQNHPLPDLGRLRRNLNSERSLHGTALLNQFYLYEQFCVLCPDPPFSISGPFWLAIATSRPDLTDAAAEIREIVTQPKGLVLVPPAITLPHNSCVRLDGTFRF